MKPTRLVAILASGLLISACAGGAKKAVTTTASAADPTSAAGLQASYRHVISSVAPDVVQISTPRGLGSGVVFDDRGDIVTNAHVVAGGGPFTVSDSRGRRYNASLVGSFTPDDLAVVKAHRASLKAASFGDSRALQVGDIVLAIGNPLGLRSSVTNGIVSALGRTVSEPNGAALPNVIQTSAAINPGNSGGALVNLAGQVVGIPTLAATDPQLGGTAPGIGFAIPSSEITDIAGQIVNHGHVINSHRAYLGVSLTTGVTNGAVVSAVQRGGPAQRAGIAPGDVITAIGRHTVRSPADVGAALASLSPGETASVTVSRPDGSHATLKVKLGQYPARG